MTGWTGRCVLCAARGHHTPVDTGHVCQPCRIRIADLLDTIPRLAQAASVEPGHGHGAGRTVPASRPPIDLAGVDPALTLVRLIPGDPSSAVPLLDCLESWERAIREDRRLAPYGPASTARGHVAARTARSGSPPTTVTLVGVTGFLAAQLDWCCTQPTFGIEDYAAHLAACVRALRRWDPAAPAPGGTVVPCPTTWVDGTCGSPLHLTGDDELRCPGCGRHWDPTTLVRAVTSDQAIPDVWVDADAAASATGIPVRTIRRWAARGLVARASGRYRLTDVHAATRRPAEA